MAPPPRTEEEIFLDEVAAFHEKRGTSFDREPKVSGRPIKLYDLYRTVLREGGYDALSAERMRWRQLAKEFGLGHHHEAAMTFQLKTVYYKYLTAYEIKNYWEEEPPPPEILESLTAKGGDVRKRTLENFSLPTPRDPGPIGDGMALLEDDQSALRLSNSGEGDEWGSGSKSSTRQLRQDPKRTQIFQPEIGSTRRTNLRATQSPQASPTPYHNQQSNYPTISTFEPRNSNFTIDKYQPRHPVAMALRPVVTPAAGPDHSLHHQTLDGASKPNLMTRLALEPQQALQYLPSINMRGPNIYLRCLYGLRSEVGQEQDFALHHLVKVSFERGDRYKFEGFPQLAEALLEKCLEISVLTHGIRWTISYDENAGLYDDNVLNGSFGTDGLYEKMQAMPLLADDDFIESAQFSHHLVKVNEAGLVLRNMVLLDDNALYISRCPLLRDFLIIALNIPHQGRLAEFRQYALDIAEHTSKFLDLSCTDPLYQSLICHLSSEDRGTIVSSGRAIARVGMNGPKLNRLSEFPFSVIQKLASLLFLDNDEEIALVALDLLHQYLATTDNLILLAETGTNILPQLIPRLATLVQHNAVTHEQKIKNKDITKVSSPVGVPVVPADLYTSLLSFSEPERSNRWLRCCFEEAPNEDITQIAIWQAYQARFQANQPIPAADFIKNVSGTFTTAQAQVINGPNPRFIIKGIRPRRVVVDLKGEPYLKCHWQADAEETGDSRSSHTAPDPSKCGQWYLTPMLLWTHVIRDHLKVPQREDGGFDGSIHCPFKCRWLQCTKRTNAQSTSAWTAGRHIRVHVNNLAKATSSDATTNRSGGGTRQDTEWIRHLWYTTVVDEKGLPAGVPFMATLVLKQLAYYGFARQPSNGAIVKLLQNLFAQVKEQLWASYTRHRTLRTELDQLISMLDLRDNQRQDINATGTTIDAADTL